MWRQWQAAGHPVIPLLPVVDGACPCGGTTCTGKHPAVNNWQADIDRDFHADDLDNHYGVRCDNLLVVDVDYRNGGEASEARLIALLSESKCIVATGSHDGSKHYAFRKPENWRGRTVLHDYPGIDFKSSGFIVGIGSMHTSGYTYDLLSGHPADIELPPYELVTMLTVTDCIKIEMMNGRTAALSVSDVVEILELCDPDSDYDEWVQTGMAVHHALGGSEIGFEIWDAWCRTGEKYQEGCTRSRWFRSFRDDRSTPITMATLIHSTKWRPPIDWSTVQGELAVPPPPRNVDLLNPPGLVGMIAEWITATGMYHRRSLAVQAALYVVAACGGLRHRDDWDTRANFTFFGVAGSATGKDHIFSCIPRLLKCAEVHGAVVGTMKSEQEIIRNLVEHQAAFYVIDEAGELLGKISNAKGASYLEGIAGVQMSLFSASNRSHQVGGDVHRELRDDMLKQIARLNKLKDDGELVDDKIEAEMKKLHAINDGLVNPYFHMIGFTTPAKFETLVNVETVTTGAMSRALIAKETVDNPPFNTERVTDKCVPDEIAIKLSQLYGHTGEESYRIERQGDMIDIEPTSEALKLRNRYQALLFDIATMYDDDASNAQLLSVPRRALEMLNKVALTLSMSDGEITDENMRWAYAYVCEDIKLKTNIALSNSQHLGTAITAKVLTVVDSSKDKATPFGRLKNKTIRGSLKDVTDAEFSTAINHMVSMGKLKVEERLHARNGTPLNWYWK